MDLLLPEDQADGSQKLLEVLVEPHSLSPSAWRCQSLQPAQKKAPLELLRQTALPLASLSLSLLLRAPASQADSTLAFRQEAEAAKLPKVAASMARIRMASAAAPWAALAAILDTVPLACT